MSTWTDWVVRYIDGKGTHRERSFTTAAARERFLTRGADAGTVSQVLAYADPTPALTNGDAVRHIHTGETGVVVGREHRTAVQVQTTPDVTVVWYDESCVTI
jgi:hypothetical protein